MSKGSEPAFASVWKPNEQQAHWGHKEVMHSGLTKREYFAGLALQGILSNSDLFNSLVDGNDGYGVDVIAVAATDQADALLAELEKTA